MYCLNVAKRGEERQVTTLIVDDLSGQNVLLVEDMLETARSMKAARSYLEKDKGANIKTACLYTMPNSEIAPDYFLH
jgi:hypoxanthine phosphoribosyltransferase